MSDQFTTKLSYTARDFETITEELSDFVKETRPGAWSDFFQSNLGMALIDMLALVGDMLSYGQDVIAQEIFLATCRRYESALRFARSVGYQPRAATASEVIVKSLGHPDSLVVYGGTIAKGSIIQGQNGFKYELLEDFNIGIGESVSRVTLYEGESFEEDYEPTAKQGQEVFTANGVVEQDSWKVYVGDPNIGTNLWEEVENVLLEATPTKTYDTYLDGAGRLHVRFGDGVSGLVPDQTITLRYRTTNGQNGNAPMSAIRGALEVTLAPPGVGTVSVEYENRDTEAAATSTELVTGEVQGTTAVGAFFTGTLQKTPDVTGSVTLVFNIGAGILALRDNGAGEFEVISNTTPHALVASSLTYSTGAYSVQVTPDFPAGASVFADYYYVKPISVLSLALTGAATGGTDREGLEELRVNIPAYIRSQDRILTLQDYNEVVRRVAGVALAFADTWVSSYSANVIRIHVWGKEDVEFQSTSDDGSSATATYTRYNQIAHSRVNDILAYVTPRTLVTVHNVILRPLMLWVDLYLGSVKYDKRYEASVVRQSILDNVIAEFASASGFALRISDLYRAVESATGVKHFQIERLSTGNQAYSDELQGITTATTAVSGTLLEPVVSPKSVTITIEQTDTASIILRDNGFGQLLTDDAVVTSSSLDYRTGQWSVTFDSVLIPNQRVLASYSDVKNDYRADQIVELNSAANGDAFPPPGVSISSPVTTPPYRDGAPLAKQSFPTVVLQNDAVGSGGNVDITHTGSVNIASAGMEGGDASTKATGWVRFLNDNRPDEGDTVFISDGTVDATFEFRFAGPAGPGNTLVLIGPDAYDTMLNFVAAINAAPGLGVTGVSGNTGAPVPPWFDGDTLTYAKLIDIVIQAVASSAHFYDETYQYNNEILYDSLTDLEVDVRAINLRKLHFNLVAV